MDQADSCIAEPQIELTTAVDNNVTTPNLTHMAKSPFSTVKPAFSDMYDPWGICRSHWVPVYEECPDYKRRLHTHDNWPKQMNPRPEELEWVSLYQKAQSSKMCSFLAPWKRQEYVYILVLPPMISSETYQFALWKKMPSAILF